MKIKDNKDFASISETFRKDFAAAVAAGDDSKMSQVIADYAVAVQEAVIEEASNQIAIQSADNAVLAGRGVRTLTSSEAKYYQRLIEAMESDRPMQAMTGGELVIPRTIIDATLDDIQTSFPLLDAIDFRNTTGLAKVLYNAADVAMATWGKLTSAVTEELDAAMAELDVTACKLTAYLPVSKDFIRLAKTNLSILDNYIRAILAESYGMGAETAVVNGTGKDQPIGMMRDTSKSASVSDGVYPERAAVKIANLGPTEYGKVLSTIAKTPTGRKRTITNLILVCSPADYFSKIFPATTVMAADGTYRNDVLPYPTRVIQSAACPSGKAVLGLAKRYLLCAALPRGIEYSDDVRFLEDERVYLGRFLGNGRPKDATAFVTLDISEVVPVVQHVVVDGTVTTTTGAAAASTMAAKTAKTTKA